jgi:hypothetical protein
MTEILALLLSAAIEGPIAYAVVAFTRWPCRGPVHVAIATMLATAVTHPQLWSASLWLYERIGYWPAVGCGEAVVILVEAAIIAWASGLSSPRALAVSAVANAASALTGLIWFA